MNRASAGLFGKCKLIPANFRAIEYCLIDWAMTEKSIVLTRSTSLISISSNTLEFAYVEMILSLQGRKKLLPLLLQATYRLVD